VSQRTASAGAFGRVMKEVRVARGLSQEEAGLRADVGRRFYGELERGEANPTFATILKVSRGLEIAAAELVARAEAHLVVDDDENDQS
jgi:transcriptional regulator with XRE-family HTH domain